MVHKVYVPLLLYNLLLFCLEGLIIRFYVLGATSLYSEQLRPLCQAGEEPVRLANANLLTCSPCAVGTFKPHYGYDNCFPCHEGMGMFVKACLIDDFFV